jgi:hypothetical protein
VVWPQQGERALRCICKREGAFEDGAEGRGGKDGEGTGRTVGSSECEPDCPRVSYESIIRVGSRASGREEFKS